MFGLCLLSSCLQSPHGPNATSPPLDPAYAIPTLLSSVTHLAAYLARDDSQLPEDATEDFQTCYSLGVTGHLAGESWVLGARCLMQVGGEGRNESCISGVFQGPACYCQCYCCLPDLHAPLVLPPGSEVLHSMCAAAHLLQLLGGWENGLNVVDGEGNTVAHILASRGLAECLSAFLHAASGGVLDLTKTNHAGLTSLQAARYSCV